MSLTVVTAIGNFVSSFFERKAKVQEAKATAEANAQVSSDNYDTTALKQMQFTFKDEYLMGVYTTPLILAWFDPERASKWVLWIQDLPLWYQVFLGGILASTFGLRWWFKREQTKVFKEVLDGKRGKSANNTIISTDTL